MATLQELITVKELGPEVRQVWAQSLADWPRQMAAELDGQGLPGTQVLEAALSAAESYGYVWPVRYQIQ